MKADFQKLPQLHTESSFRDFWVKADFFGFHWHYHPEVEICYVKRGTGTRIIGDNVADFTDGDLVLVGSNVPHSWITDEAFNQSNQQIEVYVVQFNLEVLSPLQSLIEFEQIEKLLRRAQSGLAFHNVEESVLLESLLDIEHQQEFGKYIQLLKTLNLMGDYADKHRLCSHGYRPDYNTNHETRILTVCNYIHDHYKDPMRIDDLAELVSMNSSAFCRFFKRTIGITVVEYINELRIGYVKNQLQQSSLPIYKISFDAGFSSVAYFNRVFKKLTGKTPKQYRNKISNYRVVG